MSDNFEAWVSIRDLLSLTLSDLFVTSGTIQFLEQHGHLSNYSATGLKPEFNESQVKWLRSAVASYSYHFQLCAWFNIPLYQVIGVF